MSLIDLLRLQILQVSPSRIEGGAALLFWYLSDYLNINLEAQLFWGISEVRIA